MHIVQRLHELPSPVRCLVGVLVPAIFGWLLHTIPFAGVAHRFPFFVFYPTIVVAVHLAGIWAGVTASVTSAVIIDRWFLDSAGEVPVGEQFRIVQALYMLTGVSLAYLHANLRRRAEMDATENRQKDEFLAVISHELRTPLNVVLGYARMLHQREADDRIKRLAEIMERNAVMQLRIVEDLLDMQRIISGRISLSPERVAINHLVDNVVESLNESLVRKGLHWAVKVPEVTLDVDGARMQQVIWNLCTNAIKFTPERGCVGIRGEVLRDGRFCLSVVDSGEGIPRDFLPHVFDKFRQLDMSTTRRHFGIGLGLTIAKALVELHGGKITAESPGPGKGATFTVTLPPTTVIEVAT
jgi:signal transduction histidine kinase